MTESSAVRHAREDQFEDGVRLATLEWQQALETPSLRSGMALSTIALPVKAIALVAPLGGVLAPFGGSGADVFSGTDLMSPDLARSVAVICFWIAAVGQAWALIDWWRFGRPKDGYGIAAASLSVAAAVVAMWWHTSRSGPADLPMLAVPIVTTGVLGAVGLVARLIGSRNHTMRQTRLIALGTRMRSLPGEEQQALLAERREILDVLHGRGLVDRGLVERASAVRLGDWWLLDDGETATRSESPTRP
ncbi:hypothetical protein [Microbacterium lushaniae]|uniref:Uncharacterized protein n=1 Tax=Microbacterium lushaniae TaxID=2614639 RepID=A0A5J6L395_9MICO|nr:hypothetical protein [Microbacterium lushaniae]QEW03018.1 hypothetical protein F6J85_07830 [Microbacterium lushaniae]